MNQNKLTFQSENLVVDWISFNIQGGLDKKLISNHFFAIGFNSTIAKRINGKWKAQCLKYDSRNKFQVSFRQYEYDPESKSFWVGTQIYLSGKNAAYFYSCIKKYQFDWNLLELRRTNLGRLDLHYFRQFEPTDSKLEDFMKDSCQKIRAQSKRKKASWMRTQKGLLMRIGSRSSSNFYRVYEKEKKINHKVYTESIEGLEFELELKNELVKLFQELLFSNQIEEFEHRLSHHFVKQSLNYLVLDFCYTDWLAKLLRKIVKRPKFNPGLVTDYLGLNSFYSFADKEYLFRLLQFLSFIRNLTGIKQFIDDQTYYILEFPVADFIVFLGANPKSSYQRNKLLDFLKSLQGFPPLVEQFSEIEFRSSVMFPLVKLEKKSRSWILKIAIGEQLYSYAYPFVFSNSLGYFKTKYDLIVKLEIIKIFSKNSLEKKFPVENFLNEFGKNDRTQIKKLIISLLDELKQSKLIESNFNIVLKKGFSKRVENLTPLLLNQSKDIFFYEIIDGTFLEKI